MSERHDGYLWDRSGPPDPEVAALERALGRLRHRGAAPPMPSRSARPAGPGARRRRGGRALAWAAAAAAAAAAAVWLGGLWTGSAPEVRLRVRDSGQLLAEGEELRVVGRPSTLEMDRSGRFTGELTLEAGSHLEVRRLSAAQTDLWLRRGRMDAFVSADAEPRFFQVGTRAATCVDLGCQYTLTVDDAGNAWVEVTLGRVAFRNRDGREVLVLRGATCRATEARGAGTPRFSASPEALQRALDDFDAALAPAERRRLAVRALAAAESADPRHGALPAWHLMADPDPAVAAAATRHLEARFGRPEGLSAAPGTAPSEREHELWKAHLGLQW